MATNSTFSTYGLSTNGASVNEGSTVIFTLTTTKVTSGASVAYTLSGISSADILGGSLSGNAVVNSSGVATISVTLLNDNLTEGPETLIRINDTSITLVGVGGGFDSGNGGGDSGGG